MDTHPSHCLQAQGWVKSGNKSWWCPACARDKQSDCEADSVAYGVLQSPSLEARRRRILKCFDSQQPIRRGSDPVSTSGPSSAFRNAATSKPEA